MSYSPTAWRANKSRPCPVCRRGDNNCSVTTDHFHRCRSEHDDLPGWHYLGDDRMAFGQFRAESDDGTGRPPKRWSPDMPPAAEGPPPPSAPAKRRSQGLAARAGVVHRAVHLLLRLHV